MTGVFAVDGHDGAGKTTLARWVATRIRGSYQRPFQGALGASLLSAGDRGDVSEVIAVGTEGVEAALAGAGDVRPVILDRCWMTVASLVEWEAFVPAWRFWIPTVLCWADLETSLDRLRRRTDSPEAVDQHRHYLARYLELAERTGSLVLRTDLHSTSKCQELLLRWLGGDPSPPRIELPP